jgi:membrane-bound lytic murein transglycosylase B
VKTHTSPFYMALQTSLALRQITAALLLLALFAGGASAKSHAKAHKPAAHKAAAKQASNRGVVYGKTAEAIALADELAQQYNLPKTWVREQVSKAQYLKGVPKMVLPPTVPTAKNWRAYRERFIESRRIEAGTQFWQTHQSALTRAEQTYGVPAEMIVGIIGVETFYGQNMGNYRVLDALTTLTLNFPASHPRAVERQAFFKSELGHFLVQAHSQGDASATGSFAGAMGWPQFMPSSTAKFAVDFDGDGRIDLRNSPVDAIGSVANYFKAFGWQTGMPTHYPVGFDEARLDKPTLLAPDILPSFSVSNFTAKGAVLDEQAQKHNGPLALVELFNGEEPPSYVAGTENFYVVTRYNWSSYYALAVIELGQAVRANRALNSVQSSAR